jgi:hypothetical protein
MRIQPAVQALLRRLAVAIATPGAMVLLFIASPASACRFKEDPRPLEVRVAEAPVAFVGTVTAAGPNGVTFGVEIALKGTTAASYTTATTQGSCAIRFRVGDRWLFAGPTRLDPSKPLGSGSQPLADAVGRLKASTGFGL